MFDLRGDRYISTTLENYRGIKIGTKRTYLRVRSNVRTSIRRWDWLKRISGLSIESTGGGVVGSYVKSFRVYRERLVDINKINIVLGKRYYTEFRYYVLLRLWFTLKSYRYVRKA